MRICPQQYMPVDEDRRGHGLRPIQFVFGEDLEFITLRQHKGLAIFAGEIDLAVCENRGRGESVAVFFRLTGPEFLTSGNF